jgi:hypothetical protein
LQLLSANRSYRQTDRSALKTIIKFSDNFADTTTYQMSNLNIIIHYGFTAHLNGMKSPCKSHKCVLIYSFVRIITLFCNDTTGIMWQATNLLHLIFTFCGIYSWQIMWFN